MDTSSGSRPKAARDGGSALGRLVGKDLRRLRQEKGWSQQRLAETAGVIQQNLSAYERGDSDPRLETLGRLLDALGAELRIEPRSQTAAAEPVPPQISLPDLLEYVDRQVERALEREREQRQPAEPSGTRSA